MNIYKAGSHKTDTFFVQQMKVSLKTVSIKRPHDFNEKTILMKKVFRSFSLKCYLVYFVFFSSNNLFRLFLVQSTYNEQ